MKTLRGFNQWHPTNGNACALQVTGSITYNGHNFSEFLPERTASYIDQTDTHLAELTVRETFDFAARCQGTGHKSGQASQRVNTC